MSPNSGVLDALLKVRERSRGRALAMESCSNGAPFTARSRNPSKSECGEGHRAFSCRPGTQAIQRQGVWGTTSQPCLSPRSCSSLYQLFRTPADAPGSRSLQPQLCDSSSLTATVHYPRSQGADFWAIFSVGHPEAELCQMGNPSAVPKAGSRVLARFPCPGIHGTLIRCEESCLLSVVKPSTKPPSQL